jgi:F5/8 type C domain
VTETDQVARPGQRPSAGPGAGPPPGGVFEFFWRGAALARRREDVARKSERAFAFAQRARTSAKFASLALSSEPREESSEGIACELFRQSAYWAACALAEARSHSVGTTFDESVWDELDDSTPTELRDLARSASFVRFSELEPEEKNRVRVALQALARNLLVRFGELNTVRAIYGQRIRRLSALVAGIVGIIAVGFWVRDLHEQSKELVDGKSWRISSNYGGGCKSPLQDCKNNFGYFFHTNPNDHDPWVEFDLATTQQISRLEVENRRDCCFDRASPLVFEVSVDHRKWQEVTRHDGEFANWKTTFPPVPARWVRLRVPKTTALHLNKVRIFP